MRVLLIAAALPLMLGAAACQSKWEKEGHTAQPSGTGASRSFDAKDFTAVDLRGSDDVEVRNGAAFSVTAEGEPKVLDLLDIRVVDGTLRVGRKNSGSLFQSDHGAKIHVTLPRLTAASVSGSGNLDADRGEGDFHASVAGSGNLKVATLAAGELELSTAGSGDMDVGGTAAKYSADIVGSGDIDASKLTANGASISITGSGSLKGVVKGGASVSIAGSGDVDLTGGANCSVNAVGSGEAHCS